jgi:hypothetical protein
LVDLAEQSPQTQVGAFRNQPHLLVLSTHPWLLFSTVILPHSLAPVSSLATSLDQDSQVLTCNRSLLNKTLEVPGPGFRAQLCFLAVVTRPGCTGLHRGGAPCWWLASQMR